MPETFPAPLDGWTSSAPSPGPSRLSEDLQHALDQADGKDVSFGQILQTTRGRGFLLLIIFLTLPFLIPVTIPGSSIPVGLAIALFGIRISIGKRPFIPDWLLKRRISHASFQRMMTVAVRVAKRAEKLLRPRLYFIQRWSIFRLVNGLATSISGVALMLPIPPIAPLTNWFPAVAIVFLAAGMMEEDGLFILLGYFVTVCAWLYLFFLLWMGQISLDVLLR